MDRETVSRNNKFCENVSAWDCRRPTPESESIIEFMEENWKSSVRGVLNPDSGKGEIQYGHFNPDMVQCIVSKIVDSPSVVRCVFHYARQKHPRNWSYNNFRTGGAYHYLVVFQNELFNDELQESEKFYYLLLIAGMYNKPELVTRVASTSIDKAWHECGEWLKDVASFSYYDRARKLYVVDPVAMRTGVAVAIKRQIAY